MLEQYKKDVTGILNVAQSRFFLQRIEAARATEDHERAAAAVLATARQSTEYDLSPAAWRELIVLGLLEATRAGALGLISELVDQYAWLAFSGEHEGAQPWPLGEVFMRSEEKAGAYLGDLLARAYPNCALGPYAAAHFREVSKLGNREPFDASWAATNAARFERAAQLAEHAGRTSLATHCALRQGVCVMLGGVDTQRGRSLLKALDQDALSPAEQLWYAIGMTRSDFWLDRVRAADAIDAIATDVIEARPGKNQREIDRATIERVVDDLLGRQGAEIQAAEEDRLRALVALVYKKTPWRAEQKLAALDLLLDLQEHASTPLSESHDLIQKLEERTPAMGESWTDSARMMRGLHILLDAESPTPPLPRQPPHARHTFSLRAMEVLAAIRAEDDGLLEQALLQTRRDLQQPPKRLTPDALSPIAVALPSLIQWIKQHAPKKRRGAAAEQPLPEEEIARIERHAFIKEVTMASVKLWAASARAPSYGWWKLTAHLCDASLYEAADAAGARALAARQQEVDASTREFALGKLLAWSIEEGDRRAMTRWLEAAEAAHEERA